MGRGHCLVEPVQPNVELSLLGLISSQAGPGQYLDDRARAYVEPSGPRSMSSRLGRCRVERAWADVVPNGLGLMSSGAGPSQYPDDRAKANIEPSGARTDVEPKKPGLMPSCPSPRFRVVKVRADVGPIQPHFELSLSGSLSSQAGPGRYLED